MGIRRQRNKIVAEGEVMARETDDTDLLVHPERDNIKDDYRLFYSIKRNNLFSSIQNGFSDHFGRCFCRLDEIWRREVSDITRGEALIRIACSRSFYI